jgi:DNA-3-methyladenine glycosylase I
MINHINISPAKIEDASFIAWAVETAINDEELLCRYCGFDFHFVLTQIAKCPTSQYGYPNALIAKTNDGKRVGAIIGYDGAQLATLRKSTFSIIHKHTNQTPSLPDETQPGEFYIDSLAVVPEYQGQGIATSLIQALCLKAKKQGHDIVGLIAEERNEKALKLYQTIGFKMVGITIFFTHPMKHLQKMLT